MFKIISSQELMALPRESLNFFDVRDEASYQSGHIENACFLSAENFDSLCVKCDKSKPTIVYCYKGIRSQVIANILFEHGFKKVYSLAGGFSAWQEAKGV